MESIEKYFEETHLYPYAYPERIRDAECFRILPVYRTSDFVTAWVAKKILIRAEYGEVEYIKYPYISYVRYSVRNIEKETIYGPPLMSRVAVRTGDGWLDEHATVHPDAKLMKFVSAVELSRGLEEPFDYAVISWRSIMFLPFMLSKKAFDKTPLSYIMGQEVTPQHVAISKLINIFTGSEWSIAGHLP